MKTWAFSIVLIIANFSFAEALELPELIQSAQETLTTAAKKDPKLAPLFRRASEGLAVQIKVLKASDQLFSLCDLREAFYLRKSNQIFLCPDLLERKKDYLVQRLIHEASHAGGLLDECTATRVEYFAMEAAGKPIAPLAYDCGL